MSMFNRTSTRRDVLKAGIAAAGVFAFGDACGSSGGSSAGQSGPTSYGPAKFTWRLPISGATDSDGFRAIQHFADKVKANSKGAINIQIFPNAQFGSDLDNFKNLQSGAFEIATVDTSVAVSTVPSTLVFQLPYLYNDAASAAKVYNNSKFTAKPTRDLLDLNVKVLRWVSFGARDLGGQKAYVQPSDLQGVKIRVIQSELFVTLFKTLGAVPTPLSPAEVYAALQSGVVQAYDQPVANILGLKWYEVGKQITLTDHVYAIGILAVTKKVWDGLSPDLQAAVQGAADDWQPYLENLENVSRTTASDLLKAKGAVINRANLASYRKATQPVWEHFASQVGGMDVINQIIAAQK